VPQTRELACRDGLKYYARIAAKNIRAAQDEVEKQRAVLYRARPQTRLGEILAVELDMAARMAAESCRIMLWQQALVGGRDTEARRMAAAGIRALQEQCAAAREELLARVAAARAPGGARRAVLR